MGGQGLWLGSHIGVWLERSPDIHDRPQMLEAWLLITLKNSVAGGRVPYTTDVLSCFKNCWFPQTRFVLWRVENNL